MLQVDKTLAYKRNLEELDLAIKNEAKQNATKFADKDAVIKTLTEENAKLLIETNSLRKQLELAQHQIFQLKQRLELYLSHMSELNSKAAKLIIRSLTDWLNKFNSSLVKQSETEAN